MENPIPHLINETARELNLKVCRNPFHTAEGFELRRQIGNTDTLICVGFISGPQKTQIYRRAESRRDIFFSNRLWFLRGWLIKPRPRDNQYKVLKEITSSEFNEKTFVDVVKEEFETS